MENMDPMDHMGNAEQHSNNQNMSVLLSADFEEVSNLLSLDPNATTLAISGPPASIKAEEDVKLDLTEDEEGLEEMSKVGQSSMFSMHFLMPLTFNHAYFVGDENKFLCLEIRVEMLCKIHMSC